MDSAIFIILLLIIVVSYYGIKDILFQEKYIFNTDRILIDKEYYRIISSGFLHGNWYHLGFNMLALSSFGAFSIEIFGLFNFLLIFTGSLISGNLLSLYIHRNHGDYRSLGASGAIFGIVFSSIVYDPLSSISFLFIPIEFPSWLIGILFVSISIWGIKKAKGNIGHDAHLGGAVFGMLMTAFLYPNSIEDNLWIYLLLGIPSIGFIVFIIKYPSYLLFDSMSVKPYIPKNVFAKKELSEEEEINQLLDKINSKGYDKLSKNEKAALNKLSVKK